MSKIALAPDENGTGIFTIASPNSNTNRTLTLPDDTGTIVTNSGNQAGSFTTLNTSGAVVFNDAGADVDFRVESDTVENALFVDGASGNVGIGVVPSALFNSVTNKLSIASTSFNLIDAVRYSANAFGPNLYLAKSRGGSIGTNTIVQSGDSCGNISFYGANGTGFDHCATISGQIDGTPGASGDMPGRLVFSTTADGAASPTERMRIDSSGNLLVGKTSSDFGVTAGFELNATINKLYVTRSAGSTAAFNRLSTDGEIVGFAKDGTTAGVLGTGNGGDLYIGNDDTGLLFAGGSDAIIPWNPSTNTNRDNVISLGLAGSNRFDDAYITNGVTTGSDRNDKQDIEELSEAEQRVAVAAKALLRKWRWKDAVIKKGDDARIHFGIIAQDLKAAFEAEGLDAHRYGMFMWNEWWETQTEVPEVEAQEAVYETQTDEEGNEVQVLVSEAVEGKEAYTRTDTYQTEAEAPEGAVRKERMGVRYSELLAFIIAAI